MQNMPAQHCVTTMKGNKKKKAYIWAQTELQELSSVPVVASSLADITRQLHHPGQLTLFPGLFVMVSVTA